MRLSLVSIITPVIALAAVLPAAAEDAERYAMGALRLTTDAGVARTDPPPHSHCHGAAKEEKEEGDWASG